MTAGMKATTGGQRHDIGERNSINLLLVALDRSKSIDDTMVQ